MRVIAAARERGGRRTSAGVAGGGARARGRGGGARARGRTSVPTPDSNLRRLALSGTGARINTTKNARAGRPAPRALRYAARTPAWPRALHCAATTSHGRSRPRIHSLVPPSSPLPHTGRYGRYRPIAPMPRDAHHRTAPDGPGSDPHLHGRYADSRSRRTHDAPGTSVGDRASTADSAVPSPGTRRNRERSGPRSHARSLGGAARKRRALTGGSGDPDPSLARRRGSLRTGVAGEGERSAQPGRG